jgi:hypothetical protein
MPVSLGRLIGPTYATAGADRKDNAARPRCVTALRRCSAGGPILVRSIWMNVAIGSWVAPSGKLSLSTAILYLTMLSF